MQNSPVLPSTQAGKRGKFRVNSALYVMLLPALVLTLVFSYLPMAGVVMAFQQFEPWLGFSDSPWVGLEHFRTIFTLPDSMQVIWNTFIISAMKIVMSLIVPFFFAILLNEVRLHLFKRTVQTLVYLPHFLSWVILGGILTDILSPSGGIVNRLLEWFGQEPIFFLGDGDWFRMTIIASDVWKEFGFSTIVFLAALAGIDPSLYEAAEADGAGRFLQTIHVTIPSLVPITIVVGTLALGNILNAGMDQVFNLYSPIVYDKGDIIDTYVYRMALLNGQLSFGTAFGLFKSIVSTFFILVAYRLAYRYGNYRIF